jgi:hypothetical protein
MNGKKNEYNYTLPDGFDMIGCKAIGAYGGLDIHGKPRNVSWTTLGQGAKAGDSNLTLAQPVDWVVGDEIVLATTSYNLNQTETFKITSVSADSLTISLNASLVFDHVVDQENFTSGASYRVSAAVGLLTRNVKIIGTEYPEQESDLYGIQLFKILRLIVFRFLWLFIVKINSKKKILSYFFRC